MLISGFTIVRNAVKLYYPVKESILSVLPIVDEFIVAFGEGDVDDNSLDEILSINDPKIRIIRREWDEKLFVGGKILAHETNFALSQCQGDWCLYIQADEVLHESDLPLIRRYCEEYKDQTAVDGFLFPYHHFWGDYDRELCVHDFYKSEIRLIRNHIHCYSILDAVSFRKGNDEKLWVLDIPAYVYHYGFVRPPSLMGRKKNNAEHIYDGNSSNGSTVTPFDYGPIGGIGIFKGSHPAVMKKKIENFFWRDQLNYAVRKPSDPVLHKHHRLRYRLVTWVENNWLNGRTLFGFKNFRRLNKSAIQNVNHKNNGDVAGIVLRKS